MMLPDKDLILRLAQEDTAMLSAEDKYYLPREEKQMITPINYKSRKLKDK